MITGFAPGEIIRDADGTPVTGAVYAATGGGLGALTLLNGSTPLGVLILAGAFDGYDFGVAHNGVGGTDITLTARVQSPVVVPTPVPAADPVPVLVVTPPAPDPVPTPVADPVPPVLVVAPPAPDPVPVPVANPVLVVTPPAPDPVPAGVPAPVANPACNAEDHQQRNLDLDTSREDSLLHRITAGQGERGVAFLTAGPLVDAKRLDLQLGATMRLAKVEAPEHAGFTVDHGDWQIGLSPSALFGASFSLIHGPDAAVIGVNPLLHDWA